MKNITEFETLQKLRTIEHQLDHIEKLLDKIDINLEKNLSK